MPEIENIYSLLKAINSLICYVGSKKNIYSMHVLRLCGISTSGKSAPVLLWRTAKDRVSLRHQLFGNKRYSKILPKIQKKHSILNYFDATSPLSSNQHFIFSASINYLRFEVSVDSVDKIHYFNVNNTHVDNAFSFSFY